MKLKGIVKSAKSCTLRKKIQKSVRQIREVFFIKQALRKIWSSFLFSLSSTTRTYMHNTSSNFHFPCFSCFNSPYKHLKYLLKQLLLIKFTQKRLNFWVELNHPRICNFEFQSFGNHFGWTFWGFLHRVYHHASVYQFEVFITNGYPMELMKIEK